VKITVGYFHIYIYIYIFTVGYSIFFVNINKRHGALEMIGHGRRPIFGGQARKSTRFRGTYAIISFIMTTRSDVTIIIIIIIIIITITIKFRPPRVHCMLDVDVPRLLVMSFFRTEFLEE